MEYTLLSKTYYADKEHYEEKYNSLKNGGFSTSLAFDIGKWEAFFVNLPEFNNVITKIYKGFSELQQLIHQLPQVAYNQYARKCLIDEIKYILRDVGFNCVYELYKGEFIKRYI